MLEVGIKGQREIIVTKQKFRGVFHTDYDTFDGRVLLYEC